jgi:copper oxidase (laccase) domain-containing protein
MIGPAISQERFEVDRDVCDRFKALGYADEWISFHEKTGKYHIDNQLTVKRQCELQGIPAANILIDRTCTYSSSDCFSHRRDKICGRHLTFILRKK